MIAGIDAAGVQAGKSRRLLARAPVEPLMLPLQGASALRSVLRDIAGKPLDGDWITMKREQEARIVGTEIRWKTGEVWTIEEEEEPGRWSVKLNGKKFTSQLKGHQLEWSDGDVWVKQVRGELTTSEITLERTDFLTRCSAHVSELTQTLDRSYTNVQLSKLFAEECRLTGQFPLTHESHFRSHQACMEFAEKLANARTTELNDNKTSGQYLLFCGEYYDHNVAGSSAA